MLKPKKKQERSLFRIAFCFVLLLTAISGNLLQTSAQDVSITKNLIIVEEQEYAFAYELYRDSLFQLSAQQFEIFIKKYPKSIKRQDAAFFSVECLFFSSQFLDASIKYSEYIQNYPTSKYLPEAYLKLGKSQLKLKKNSDAIAAFKTVMENNDNDKAGEAAYWIGEAFTGNEDTQNAIKYYTLAYENYPKNHLRDCALYSIAWTYQKRAEYTKAAEWYGKLIAEFPQSNLIPGAHVHIGGCFYYAKDYQRAINELTKSRSEIHDEEEAGNADYLIAETFYKLDNLAEAQKRYKKFLIDHPSHKFAAEVTYNLAWSYSDQNNYAKAIEVFDKLTHRTDELGHAALYRRGAAEQSFGMKEKALKTFDEVIQRERQGEWSDNALFDAGMILLEEKNISKAESYFMQLTSEFPKSDMFADGCRMLGKCLLMESNFKDAQVWFEKALTIPTASFDVKISASFNSALCLFKLKQFKEAALKFAMFIEKYPKHPKAIEAKYYQAEAEYQLGNFNESIRLYSALADNPNSTREEESLYGIAYSFYKQEKLLQAIESFEKLLVEYPKGKFAFDARLRLSDAYFLLKDYKKATGSYRTVIRMFTDSNSIDFAYYQLGNSYLKDGDNTEAFKSFDGLIKALPHSPLADDAQFMLGWINFRQKEYGEAIKEFQKLLEQFPNSNRTADAANGIQNCRIMQGKKDESKFNISESVITGIAMKDLTKLEKISDEENFKVSHFTKTSFSASQRDRETIELEMKNRKNDLYIISNKYSGLLRTGIGTYFTPQTEFLYGQVLPDFYYTFGGVYHLTKGYAPNTDQSGGSFTAAGGTIIPANAPMFRNAAMSGTLDLQEESFRFYGSSIPNLQRTISEFNIETKIDNQTTDKFPYSIGISFGRMDIADSSTSTTETKIDLNLQTRISIVQIPVQTKINLMFATGGIGFMDLSGGIQNYRYAGMLFEGSLHLYWAMGMSGQNLLRLHPHLMASYQITSRHRVYVSYKPILLPMTLALNVQTNRFLSTNSTVRHADVTNAGEIGVESDWNESVRSRVSFSVKSMQNLAMFSDSSRQGVWTLAYGGQTRIVIFCAEMFAKLTSNDYFGSKILLRSTKAFLWGEQIPYLPAIEGGCYASHRFGTNISASADVKFIGERKANFVGKAIVSSYAVMNVKGEYTPLDFLSVSLAIKNVTNARYEIWRGYREFPLTMQADVQVKW